MPDFIRPTPQNPTLGAIARALSGVHEFAARPFGYANPPGEMLSELLGVPATARTVERLSYGEPLTTGAGGIGGTTRPREDTVDAALTVTPLAHMAGRVAGRGAMALGRAGERLAERAVPPIMERGGKGAELLQALGQGTTSNVIKPKGGNWLAGHTDYAMRPLRTSNAPVLSGEMVDEASRLLGGRDIFGEYRKAYDQDMTLGLHEWTRKNHPEVYAQLQGPEGAAADRFIAKKLEPYTRNEMGTPEDPVRALAERGVLHFDPPATGPMRRSELGHVREMEGFPSEGLGQTPLARNWEALSDSAINAARAGDYLKFMGDTEYAKTIEKNPWLKKVPPETKVYGTAEAETLADDLGFEHLIDELKFSMDPNSGLPANLRLDPKDIDKITVPQAVERVAKINAWRAEEAAKAERAGMMENLTATPRLADDSLQLSFVDKPGGAWVDIPETVNDKGMKLCNSIGKAGGWCTQHEWAAKSYGSGENRLTALVDAEGRPHAQAKITRDVDHAAAVEDAEMYMTPEQINAYDRHFQKFDRPPELEESLAWLEENAPDAYAVYREVLNSQPKSPPDITELKPPGNSFSSDRAKEYAKRDPQYKEKVTDSVLKFLNGGDWGKVNDLNHYDIVDLKDPNSLLDAMKTLYGDESSRRVGQEFIDAFNHAVSVEPNAPRFMTPRQLREFIGPVEPLEGYAGGGLVKGAVKSIGEMVEKYIAKESANTAKQRVYHGGTYTPGSEIKKPLFASPNKELASAYIYDDYGNIAGKLSEMSHSARNPANEEKLLEVAKKLGIKVDEANVPLSLFDKSMYGQKNVNRLLTELKRQGYDSAEGTDIGAGTSITDKAIVLFPGTKTAPIVENAPALPEGRAGGGLVGLHAKYERGGRVRPGEGLPDPTLMNFQLYADTVSREMFPDKAQNPQRDAARHLLASALAAQKTTPGIAEFLGKAHEFKEAPLRTAGHWLGVSDPRADYPTDVHNNALGIQLGQDKRSLRELLDAVEAAVRSGTPTRQPGRVSLEPDADTRYAEGGAVKFDADEIARLAASVAPGYAAGGLVNYDPAEIDTIVSRVKEEFHG